MKGVLLLEKPPAAVITNGSSTPEEMAGALLSMNKVMQGLIKRFKLELKLEDSESAKWKEELRENSKRRQKIERTEEKKRKRQALKEQKAMARKRNEWLEQNCPNGGSEEAPKDDSISTVPGWKVEEVEEEKLPKEIVESKPILAIKKPKIKRTKPVKDEKPIRNDVPIKKSKPEVQPTLREPQENPTPEYESDEGSQPESFKPSDDDNAESETEETTHVVDPFFVTETGENYLSTAVVSKSQVEETYKEEEKDRHLIQLNGSKKYTDFRDNRKQQRREDSFPQKDKWQDKKYSQHPNRFERRRQDQQQRGENKFPQRNKWNDEKHSQKLNRFGNDNRRQGHQRFDDKPKDDFKKNIDAGEKLHPSWAAKQKLKPIITGFQGKKIVFGDGEGEKEDKGNVRSLNVNKSAKETKPQNVSSENLHPSWAAKQKQKPVITAFQGKKISFDNDD